MTEPISLMPSIAEDVQLMMFRMPDWLVWSQGLIGAAALIELALLGRIVADPKATIIRLPADDARLVVVDAAPTGSAMLDVALSVLVARRRAASTPSVIMKVTTVIAPHLHAALVSRGIVRDNGGYARGRVQSEIADDEILAERILVLTRARAWPESVIDPRLSAVIDVLGSSDRYSFDGGSGPLFSGDSYPPGTRDTIASILKATRRLYATVG